MSTHVHPPDRTGASDRTQQHETDDLRSFVTLSRNEPSDVGDRQIYIRLDQRRMKLNFGDVITEELRPGAHHLHVHNTLFWKNVPFTIEPGEHLEFVTINSRRWWTFGIVGALGAAPLFLVVEKRSRT